MSEINIYISERLQCVCIVELTLFYFNQVTNKELQTLIKPTY